MWSFDDIFCESEQVAFHCFCAKTGHFAELRYLKEITDCYIYITLLKRILFPGCFSLVQPTSKKD